MRNILLIFMIALIGLAFTQTKELVSIKIKKVDTIRPFYNYYQFDSIYNKKEKKIILKIVYTEKKDSTELIKGKKYMLDLDRWNPTKRLTSDGDTAVDLGASCRAVFSEVTIRDCEFDNGKKKDEDCIKVIAEYYRIRKVPKP